MLRLIQIELHKLIPNKSFWVFIGIYALALPAVLSAAGNLSVQLNDLPVDVGGFMRFPEIWRYAAYIASFFHLLLGFIVINLITNEYSYRTIRQQIMDGMSRFEILLAKVMIIFFLTLLAVGLLCVNCLIFGNLYSEGTAISDQLPTLSIIGHFAVQAIAYMSFAALVAFVVRRSGLAYILFFAAGLLELLIGRIIPDSLGIEDYLPMNAISKIIPRPFEEHLEMLIPIEQMATGVPLALGVLYTVLFLSVAYWLVYRADL